MTMARPLQQHLLLHLRRSNCLPYASPPTTPFRLLSLHSTSVKLTSSTRFLSTPATPYPLQYEMIISRPANAPPARRRPPPALPNPQSQEDSGPDQDLGFDAWVDKKLSTKDADDNNNGEVVMDKSKRKYYNKRRKRMYGESESDEESSRRGNDGDFVELKQGVVELRTLHKREEELYFYDAFAYPWEKDKHYKMVYQLEKKYFPDQCFDKAFLEPGKPNAKKGMKEDGNEVVGVTGEDDKGLVFFEEGQKEGKDVKVEDVTEKKVEDFFKCLKKFPNENGGDVAAGAVSFDEECRASAEMGWS
ncbi:UNVERIFIED_CONTAM: hypothetical protein Slati_1627900 [Sesamum latifolium]|uniref:Uncharacterized protein n=1 Tax=Sesamum latifolium TaxID=2727402 RepID=A0AAW2X9B3_9LAMI